MAAFIAQHLWQSTLVLIAAWVLARVCSRNSAAVRYWIWLAAGVKFLVPFALLQKLGDSIGRSLPAATPVDPAIIETGKALFVPAVPDLVAIPEGLLQQVQIVAIVVWGLGTSALLLRWFLQWRAIHATLRSAPQMAMDLPVPVHVTSGDLTPGVFGVFRPVVIVPHDVLHELDEKQLQTVFAHEMCHVRRRDNLTAAIHRCVEAIFWFHPLVWWLGANLLREREAACDESVIEEGHEQAVYAQSILHVCRLGVAASTVTMAASTGGDLTQRMTSIMSRERAAPISHLRFALLTATAMVICYGPIAAGIVSGAFHEASSSGRIAFDAVTLTLAHSEPGWWRSKQFDREAGRLTLESVSLRDLIALAYPGSSVTSDPDLIDSARYDVDARWSGGSGGSGASERSVYRELLGRILSSNSNLRISVKQ